MAMSTEEVDFYMEMLAVENLIGEVVPAELFGELHRYEQEPTVTRDNAAREESNITEEPMDVEMILAKAHAPTKSRIPTFVDVVSSIKWPTTNDDFISIEGYASDEELEFVEDVSDVEGQTSMSSEESVLSEKLEFTDIVKVVPAEFVATGIGEYCPEESPRVPEHHKYPPSWNYPQHLASPKLVGFSEGTKLLALGGVRAKLDRLVPMLEREQELRAKLFARRAKTPTTPPITPPALTEPITVASKRSLPSSSTGSPPKNIKMFREPRKLLCRH
ncbi:hypothetical protein BDV93DRAFT_508616 [Ceratobasidium sp. AG-I]|nr:hypothetical protein BDV93DRAFT_508616 [Ceratobasidium sp. AG-I]